MIYTTKRIFTPLLPPFLDDKLVQTEFIHSALHHKLFDAALGDEPEHIHLYCWSTACKLYGFLEREDDRVAQTHPIVRYVPVAIIQDSDIGSRQIDADASLTPPVRAVSKKMNLSLPGLLYS